MPSGTPANTREIISRLSLHQRTGDIGCVKAHVVPKLHVAALRSVSKDAADRVNLRLALGPLIFLLQRRSTQPTGLVKIEQIAARKSLIYKTVTQGY